MAEQKSAQERLPQPLRAAAWTLQKVPGSGMVSRATAGTLDRIGAVSPRGRRMAVYTGAGVLGVTGVVEWPVAVTGAAVAWLTRPRSQQKQPPVEAGRGAEAVGASEDAGPAAGAASTAGIEGASGTGPVDGGTGPVDDAGRPGAEGTGPVGGGPTSAHRDAASQAADTTALQAGGEGTGATAPAGGTTARGQRKAPPAGGAGGSTTRTGKAG
ncbi:hypothetical protein [Streptomyces griseus]|uniref:hypothetical protein n=1 Tax=Streptomyces griseus TaxID=1911 RepID=UPI00068DF749|nr:hypothetical protein [Streptomyces griseus]